MRVIFFFKVFKIWSSFEECRKKWEEDFCYFDNCIWIGCVKLSLLRREYLSSVVNVWKHSPKIFHITKRHFFELNFFQRTNYMIKVLSCRIQQCLAPLTMLLLKASSKTGLFGLLSNRVFCSTLFRKHITYEGHLFFQNLQNFIDISKMQQEIDRRLFSSQIVAY